MSCAPKMGSLMRIRLICLLALTLIFTACQKRYPGEVNLLQISDNEFSTIISEVTYKGEKEELRKIFGIELRKNGEAIHKAPIEYIRKIMAQKYTSDREKRCSGKQEYYYPYHYQIRVERVEMKLPNSFLSKMIDRYYVHLEDGFDCRLCRKGVRTRCETKRSSKYIWFFDVDKSGELVDFKFSSL